MRSTSRYRAGRLTLVLLESHHPLFDWWIYGLILANFLGIMIHRNTYSTESIFDYNFDGICLEIFNGSPVFGFASSNYVAPFVLVCVIDSLMRPFYLGEPAFFPAQVICDCVQDDF